jgi:CheY-like chemotaxis protein
MILLTHESSRGDFAGISANSPDEDLDAMSTRPLQVMDGYEAAQIIRKEEILRGRKRVPIIALTAHDSLGPKGFLMNDRLTRPVSKKMMVDTVTTWAKGFQLDLLGANAGQQKSLKQRNMGRRKTSINDFHLERALVSKGAQQIQRGYHL